MDLVFDSVFEELLKLHGFTFCPTYSEHPYKKSFVKDKLVFQNDNNSVKLCLGCHILYWEKSISSEILASVLYFSSLTQEEKSFFKRLGLISVNELDCYLLCSVLMHKLNDIHWLDTKLYRTYRHLIIHLDRLNLMISDIQNFRDKNGTK